MWAYGHNVNLLAANANWLLVNTTGCGIYAGRAGALKVYVSDISTTKVLVARVPINLPSDNETPTIRPDEEIKEYPKMNDHAVVNSGIKSLYDVRQIQMDLDGLLVEFLDFSNRSTFNGTVCRGDFCCKYDIEISNNTGSKVSDGVGIHFVQLLQKMSHSIPISVNDLFSLFSRCISMRYLCLMTTINSIDPNICLQNKVIAV